MFFKIFLLLPAILTVFASGSNNYLNAIQNVDLTDSQKESIIFTKNPFQYRYIPNDGKDHLQFWVKCKTDAFISLSNAGQYINPKLVIVFGGWDNTVSTIRINDGDVVKNNTPDILNINEYRGFWIKWSKIGHIMAGRIGENIPFLVYNHTEQFFPTNFIGMFCHGGSWIIGKGDENTTKHIDIDIRFNQSLIRKNHIE